MIENTQNCQFLSCKWPQYHFSIVFMMVYIIFCSLLVCKRITSWEGTHIDVNWRQCDVKYDRKCAKSSFFLYKWPQYHFSTIFMMVYINSCSLLVYQMNIYWNSTHIDVSWRLSSFEMIENTQNRQFFVCKWSQYHFQWFVWWFILIFLVSLCVG